MHPAELLNQPEYHVPSRAEQPPLWFAGVPTPLPINPDGNMTDEAIATATQEIIPFDRSRPPRKLTEEEKAGLMFTTPEDPWSEPDDQTVAASGASYDPEFYERIAPRQPANRPHVQPHEAEAAAEDGTEDGSDGGHGLEGDLPNWMLDDGPRRYPLQGLVPKEEIGEDGKTSFQRAEERLAWLAKLISRYEYLLITDRSTDAIKAKYEMALRLQRAMEQRLYCSDTILATETPQGEPYDSAHEEPSDSERERPEQEAPLRNRATPLAGPNVRSADDVRSMWNAVRAIGIPGLDEDPLDTTDTELLASGSARQLAPAGVRGRTSAVMMGKPIDVQLPGDVARRHRHVAELGRRLSAAFWNFWG